MGGPPWAGERPISISSGQEAAAAICQREPGQRGQHAALFGGGSTGGAGKGLLPPTVPFAALAHGQVCAHALCAAECRDHRGSAGS